MTKFQITVHSALYGETECCIQDLQHAIDGGFSPCGDGCDYKLTHHEREQLKDGIPDDFIGSSKLEYPLNLVALMEPKGMYLEIPQYFRFDKKQYGDVKNVLQTSGGKYVKNSFKFDEEALPVYLRIINGEKYNLKKEFQFFGTPDTLADYLVELAEIEPSHEVVEPSAGQGSIVKAIFRSCEDLLVVKTFELMPLNQTFLDKIEGAMSIGSDFLTECDTTFDRIIANPPFNKNQDIDHIRKMYDCLRPGGRLVSIASKHWEYSGNKKETAFKEWLNEVGSTIEQVPAGSFKESGTSIATCIIIIDKP